MMSFRSNEVTFCKFPWQKTVSNSPMVPKTVLTFLSPISHILRNINPLFFNLEENRSHYKFFRPNANLSCSNKGKLITKCGQILRNAGVHPRYKTNTPFLTDNLSFQRTLLFPVVEF
jgi:hypothetical protein